MKMLIFGASGRTGQVLCQYAAAAGWELETPTHAECDLLDADAVSDAVLNSKAQAVVNCAAISGLEACADDPLQAHLINAVAPAAMALACRHTGARFIHLSTDYVLDGRKSGLKAESTKCKPVSVYGESKREGELQVLEALPAAVVMRVSWVCGNPAKPSFVESTLAKAAIGDKFSMPTDAADIARAVLGLLPRKEGGIFQVCASGEPVSWYDCARMALEYAVELGALPAMPELQKTRLADAVFFKEPRPAHTAMMNQRLRECGVEMPTEAETVRHVAQRFIEAQW